MIRDTWYFTDTNGNLASTLFLTADEYAMRHDKDRLTRTKPADPHPVNDELAFWKQSSIKIVNDERLMKINSAIMVGGILIDGDAIARESVATKRREIDDCRSRNEPIGACVWRDALNVTHTFTPEAYQLWLQDAAIAMSQRATRVLAGSWVRKAAVEAATTIEQVRQAMDASANSEVL